MTQIVNASGNVALLLGYANPVILVDSNGNAIDTFGGSGTQINGISGNVTLVGAGSVSVVPSGQTIFITGNSSGTVGGPMTSQTGAIATWANSIGSQLLNTGILISGNDIYSTNSVLNIEMQSVSGSQFNIIDPTISNSAFSILGSGSNTIFLGEPNIVVTSGNLTVNGNISGNNIYENGNLVATYNVLATTSGLAATAIQSASNSGTGFDIFNSKNGTNLIFNTVSGIGTISTTLANGVITFSGTNEAPIGTYVHISGDVMTGPLYAPVISGSNIVANTSISGATILSSGKISGTSLYISNSLIVSATPNSVGTQNTFIGLSAGINNVSGTQNIAVGNLALTTNINGGGNVAVGTQALQFNLVGNNTAVGDLAARLNISGINNTAIGYQALSANTLGFDNVAIGLTALQNNQSSNLTAVGANALAANISGTQNTAVGYNALSASQNDTNNTAIGFQALQKLIGGGSNTAVGTSALQVNISGNNNTAVGYQALINNVSGSNNIAVGYKAGTYISGLSIGASGVSNSTLLGYQTQALADNDTNEIVIGYNAVGNGSNTATLGNTSITGTYLQGNVTANSFFPSTIITSSGITLTANNSNVLTTQAGTIVINIPVQPIGKQYTILSTVSSLSNNVIISGISCTINGSGHLTLNSATLGSTAFLFSDGSNYWNVGNII